MYVIQWLKIFTSVVLTTNGQVSEIHSRVHYYFEDGRRTRMSLYYIARLASLGHLDGTEVKSDCSHRITSSVVQRRRQEKISYKITVTALRLTECIVNSLKTKYIYIIHHVLSSVNITVFTRMIWSAHIISSPVTG